ncbi:MAG: hypothetical protein IPJ62_16405 [Betaproteobacteria bacterium]|nr:hypothetical protein [Betaproteobacteria bacterium]
MRPRRPPSALDDPRIRLVQLDAADRTLGELRNIAVANARGSTSASGTTTTCTRHSGSFDFYVGP